MTDEQIHYKDNDEPCQLCLDASGYCHHHSTDADDDVSGFSLDDGLTHCPECETELRPAHVVLTQQQFNDNRCNVAVQIGCDCTEWQMPFGVNTVEKSTLPEVWRDG